MEKFIAPAIVSLILGLVVWYNLSVWEECRQTNSILYCIRMMG